MEIRTVATGVGFAEGPTILENGDVVVTSIDQGRIYRLPRHGAAEVLAVAGGGPNGSTEGSDGRIYVSQNGGTKPAHNWPGICGGIQAVQPNGEVAWITQDTVSPNDLCFGPDGLLYVTDPTRRAARDDGRLWRCDVGSGEAELLASVNYYPNGIGFGIDDAALFVASTGEASTWFSGSSRVGRS